MATTAKGVKRLVRKAENTLRTLARQYGLEFVYVIATTDGRVVETAATPKLALLPSQNWCDLDYNVPAVIQQANQQARNFRAKHGNNFRIEDLGQVASQTSLAKLVTVLLTTVIDKRATDYPFKGKGRDQKAVEEKLRRNHPWYPEAVPYDNPSNLTVEQLVTVISALTDKFDRKLLSTNLRLWRPSALDDEALRAALDHAYSTTRERDTSTEVEEEYPLIEVDGRKFLGLRATAAQIEQLGIFSRKPRPYNTAGQSFDLPIEQFYNEVQKRGGFYEVFENKDRTRSKQLVGEVAAAFGIPPHLKDLKKNLMQRWRKTLLPYCGVLYPCAPSAAHATRSKLQLADLEPLPSTLLAAEATDTSEEANANLAADGGEVSCATDGVTNVTDTSDEAGSQLWQLPAGTQTPADSLTSQLDPLLIQVEQGEVSHAAFLQRVLGDDGLLCKRSQQEPAAQSYTDLLMKPESPVASSSSAQPVAREGGGCAQSSSFDHDGNLQISSQSNPEDAWEAMGGSLAASASDSEGALPELAAAASIPTPGRNLLQAADAIRKRSLEGADATTSGHFQQGIFKRSRRNAPKGVRQAAYYIPHDGGKAGDQLLADINQSGDRDVRDDMQPGTMQASKNVVETAVQHVAAARPTLQAGGFQSVPSLPTAAVAQQRTGQLFSLSGLRRTQQAALQRAEQFGSGRDLSGVEVDSTTIPSSAIALINIKLVVDPVRNFVSGEMGARQFVRLMGLDHFNPCDEATLRGMFADDSLLDLWCDDEIINSRMAMCQGLNTDLVTKLGGQYSVPRVFVVNSFFLPKLLHRNERGDTVLPFDILGASEFLKPKRMSKVGKKSIFDFDQLVLPFHTSASGMPSGANHWTVILVDLAAMEFCHIDSLRHNNGLNKAAAEAMQAMAECIKHQAKQAGRKLQRCPTGWVKKVELSMPQQLNGYDCGILMCKAVECICTGSPFTDIEPAQSLSYRKGFAYEFMQLESSPYVARRV